MTGSNGKAADPIDQAIASSAPVPGQVLDIPIKLGTTGRTVVLSVPIDMTVIELMDLGSFVINPKQGLGPTIAKIQGPGLVVPSGPVLLRPS